MINVREQYRKGRYRHDSSRLVVRAGAAQVATVPRKNNKVSFAGFFRNSRVVILIVILLCIAGMAQAQRFSYVYIQGDKQLPFYVRLDGEMLPRYSKNYYILPQLAAGSLKIEILFQQNEHPPLPFTIQVPDDGFRGFLLTRQDNTFALFDIAQRFYLMPGSGGEDRLPEPVVQSVATTGASRSRQSPAATAPTTPAAPVFMEDIELSPRQPDIPWQPDMTTEPVSDPPPAMVVDPETIAAEKAYYAVQEHQTTDEEEADNNAWVAEEPETPATTQQQIPVDPEVVEAEKAYFRQLQQQGVDIAQHPASTEEIYEPEDDPEPILTAEMPAILNSDCPEPLAEREYEQLFNNTRSRKGDDKRVVYLVRMTTGRCFTTRQVFLLARQLQAESMRYSFLKKAYPRVVDQQHFPMLDDALFKTLEWKSYFRLIYQD